MMSSTTHLTIGDLSFALKPSSRRKTIEITVDRGGELFLAAPPDVDEECLRAFVLEKQFWIYTKLAQKERLQKQVPQKQFVDGEGFLYLGRSYRLKLVDIQQAPLRLMNGRFMLRRAVVAEGRKHLIYWYTQRAKLWLKAKGIFGDLS